MLLQLWEDNRNCSCAVSKVVHRASIVRLVTEISLHYNIVSMRSPRVEAERAINSEGFWLDPTLAAAGDFAKYYYCHVSAEAAPAMLGAGTARCIRDSGGVVSSRAVQGRRFEWSMQCMH